MKPTPINQMTPYRKSRRQFREIVKVLKESPNQEIVDSSGRATGILQKAASIPTTSSAFSMTLRKLEDAGWIVCERNAKRTFRIALANGLADPEQQQTPPPPDVSTTLEVVEEETGRPGRVAARLERSMPEIVQTAVHTEFTNMMDQMLGGMGYSRSALSSEDIAQIQEENHRLNSAWANDRSQIERLLEENQYLQSLIDYLAEQEDASLRGTNAGQVTTRNSLTARQVPDVFRRTAEFLLSQGWIIRRTRGDHLAWTSPENKTVFSASTPGDVRVDHILWRKLRAQGVERPW